jgi:hypothetical protein
MQSNPYGMGFTASASIVGWGINKGNIAEMAGPFEVILILAPFTKYIKKSSMHSL